MGKHNWITIYVTGFTEGEWERAEKILGNNRQIYFSNLIKNYKSTDLRMNKSQEQG